VTATPADGVLVDNVIFSPRRDPGSWMAYRPALPRGDRTPGTAAEDPMGAVEERRSKGVSLSRDEQRQDIHVSSYPSPGGNVSLMSVVTVKSGWAAPPPPRPQPSSTTAITSTADTRHQRTSRGPTPEPSPLPSRRLCTRSLPGGGGRKKRADSFIDALVGKGPSLCVRFEGSTNVNGAATAANSGPPRPSRQVAHPSSGVKVGFAQSDSGTTGNSPVAGGVAFSLVNDDDKVRWSTRSWWDVARKANRYLANGAWS